MPLRWFACAIVCCSIAATSSRPARGADVIVDGDALPRVQYGADRVRSVLNTVLAPTDAKVHILISPAPDAKAEGYSIESVKDGEITVRGNDASGALYGCIELASRITHERALPQKLSVSDAPAFKLRGPCIGMQKPELLPGHKVYEYPYTPESFPFFYDKVFWTEYLDTLATQRMNTLYLWNGHPFASLVKLQDYPFAQEVPDDVFAKNVEMYRWITTEADRRGIWVVQMFYSIVLSKPFADHYHISTQLAAPTPEASDYMRKCLAEFVKQYPHVGLMVCLGEALQGIDNQRAWLDETVLPGIKDGMTAAGLTEEPPVVIRTHATDLRQIMPDALKVYKNLYTEAKFNGESLTTWEPRGTRQEVHLAMSKLGSTHLINIHILANLEPFRYGAQRFIQKCVQAGRDRLGARGLHLYPLFYWNWPDAPDNVSPPLKQLDRDWIWFEAWARYAWNPDIDETTDRAYWIDRLTTMYGAPEAAAHILYAYNDSGECAPRLLRRFGITEGNRQTLSLGMTLDELVDPKKYREFPELWESQAPAGERLNEYVEKEWKHEPHVGETPPQIISEVLDFSQRAVDSIDAAAEKVSRNRDEYLRLKNDVYCIRAMSQNYAAKANAALLVLRYQYSHDPADMKHAAEYLAQSLDYYRTLVGLTKDTYRFANSMQTSQRKIPVPGGSDGKPANYHWSQLLPLYEKELADFQAKLDHLDSNPSGQIAVQAPIKPLAGAVIRIRSAGAETYPVKVGERVYTDRPYQLQKLAPELDGLVGIRFSHEQAKSGKYIPIEFEADEPVTVLVGYFQLDEKTWLHPPALETDATADERGGAEPLIRNAATIAELPPLNIHGLRFDKGINKLEMRGSGSFVVLGVVKQSATIEKRDALLPGGK